MGNDTAQIWSEVAESGRWRDLVAFIRNWMGRFEADAGLPNDPLEAVLDAISIRLPQSVREWYLLAGNWHTSSEGVWILPQELMLEDDALLLHTDTQGITNWGVREADLDADDPPVISLDDNQTVSPKFSEWVSLMVVADVIFDYSVEAPIELSRDAIRAEGMRFVSSCFGDLFANAPLATATVVMYAYPNNQPVYGKARTHVGRAMLEEFRVRHV